jgi:hypothetical protein
MPAIEAVDRGYCEGATSAACDAGANQRESQNAGKSVRIGPPSRNATRKPLN